MKVCLQVINLQMSGHEQRSVDKSVFSFCLFCVCVCVTLGAHPAQCIKAAYEILLGESTH